MKALTVTSASVLALAVATGIAAAQQLSFDINRISDTGVGEKIGTATVMDAKKGGVTFKLSVKGLPKGQRGFHVHEKGDCGPAMKAGKMTSGIAAGEHYDPEATKSHRGPKGRGDKGDLPLLNATDKGIQQTVTAPRLKLSDVTGSAL